MNEWIHAAPDGTGLSMLLVARTAPAMYELSDRSFCLSEHMFGTVCKMLINAGKHRWILVPHQNCDGQRVNAFSKHVGGPQVSERIKRMMRSHTADDASQKFFP